MSEYLSKKALLEWLKKRLDETQFVREAHALAEVVAKIECGRFDSDNSEIQRLRSLLERLDSYIDFSEHLSPGDWGIEDVTGINSLFDEVREALDGHDWAYVGKNPVQICRKCKKLWWEAEKICPGTKAPEGDGNDARD